MLATIIGASIAAVCCVLVSCRAAVRRARERADHEFFIELEGQTSVYTAPASLRLCGDVWTRFAVGACAGMYDLTETLLTYRVQTYESLTAAEKAK